MLLMQFHFYADDTVIYCCGATFAPSPEYLQSAFGIVESQLFDLKLVLNPTKATFMFFVKKKL